jgi:Lon protease-like protein
MREIPLFPLNIFLLPGDFTQLYIFEERYKQLVEHSLQNKTDFGIPFSNKLNTRNYGSLAQIVEVVKKYPGGEMDILIKGTGIFVLEQFFYQMNKNFYPGGRISDLEITTNSWASSSLLSAFKNYLVKHEVYNSELLSKKRLGLFEIANALKINDLERLELINLGKPAAIDEFLSNYIHYLELLHEQEEYVYDNIYLN